MFWHLIWQTSCVTCPSGSGYKTVLLIKKAWSRRKPATSNASFQCTRKEHIVCIFSSFFIDMAIPPTLFVPYNNEESRQPCKFSKRWRKTTHADRAPQAHLHSRALQPSLPLPKYAMPNFSLIPQSSRYFLPSPAVSCFYKHIHAWYPQSLLTDPTEGATRDICRLQAENYWSSHGTCGSCLPLSDHLKITLLFIIVFSHLAFIPLYT